MTTPIPDVDAFPGIARRPSTGALSVTRGAAGIGLEHPGLGLIGMTIEQSLALEERLAAARTDVDAALDAAPPLAFRYRTEEPCARVPPAVYALSNGRCDSCCAAIAEGARTLAHWEESAAGVRVALLHVERCPTRCSALETRPIPDPDMPGGVLYEMSLCPSDAVSTAKDGTGRCERHQEEMASG